MLSLQQQETRFFVSPKLGVNVMLTDTINAHASSGLAFKPSGFSIANINTNLSHYNQETTWHNELGITIEEMAGQLSLSFTGFYYAITDYQIERYFTEFDYGIANAAKAHSYGFEAESEWRLNENLSLQTQIGYTQTRFDTYRDPITDADYAGNMAPFIPETNGLLALQYQHPQGYFARAEWQFTGTTYFDDSNTALMRQNSYDLAHLRIGYEHKPFSAYAFVSNLGDNRYYTSKFLGVSGVPGEPRLIGVKLTVDF
ncbi:hypothetical protein VZ94_08160 [Methylocucumis oryzae]|uniref:TonB-dependent receptor-like beta-barrel domain-containing protein n=2 Tax=Methylocucumis oryzae TaxID=1632867 RepID=A0A0F3IK49_9GAMM|nr:hypothetical protein VZ94_08160 [Methylocucumis oryzae]